jgi:hypothetical protein
MKNKNEWEAPSQEEQQLMVMRAEIDELKQKKPAQGQQSTMKKLMDKLGNKVQATKKVRQGGKYKGKSIPEDPEWPAKNIKPNPLTKIMQHRNKPWHWCSPATGGKCDGCWRVHKPSECRGIGAPGQNRVRMDNEAGDEQQLRMMQALTAVLMENEDNEMMDESDD